MKTLTTRFFNLLENDHQSPPESSNEVVTASVAVALNAQPTASPLIKSKGSKEVGISERIPSDDDDDQVAHVLIESCAESTFSATKATKVSAASRPNNVVPSPKSGPSDAIADGVSPMQVREKSSERAPHKEGMTIWNQSGCDKKYLLKKFFV